MQDEILRKVNDADTRDSTSLNCIHLNRNSEVEVAPNQQSEHIPS